ncbi:DarT ssDNA thymidine ADP-ribosyltransferase family protein [Pedobacter polysacchareus]|uniref:DarT ssDNA thymidine ADP-ribosyltransferase family protein n=1 Tax=Pedobacter polysacchareus TaxID=2861973 RepID=UPI001C99CAC2|nr:DarT ssDNA thymidine ADP-ribosyltransferase family protein [Pedobacter polysacchareus]
MSLLEPIKIIFEENTNYELARQLVNQAASLKYLSSDLYRDSKRFIYELLQNADDSSVNGSKVKVAIKLFGDKLVVAHTGKAFDARDVRGITGVDDGTKKNAVDKTGFKGIGFKAVFGQSNHVVIFSEGEYFKFDADTKHTWRSKWGESQEIWEAENARKFEMPWQLIPIITEINEIDKPIHHFLTSGAWTVATIVTLKRFQETKKGINDLIKNVNMFLFLKNIELIQIASDEEVIIKITEDESSETTISVNNIEKAHWLKHTITLKVPTELTEQLENETDMPEKLRVAEKVDITLAAKVTAEGISALENNEQLLYAYLPTEENGYKIPILVNGAFYTVANRENLHKQSLWNEWLFSCIPTELLKWIAGLVSDKKYDAYNLLPAKLLQSDPLADAYNKSLQQGFQNIPLVINTASDLLRIPESLIDFTFLSGKNFVGGTAIRNFIITDKALTQIHTTPFVPNIGYASKLKKIGVTAFHWGQMPALLKNPQFIESHNATNNIALISHLMAVSQNEKIADVNDTILIDWPFIMNHKSELKSPKEVFFPSADDVVDATSNISFIHDDLQQWLDSDQKTKTWLEALGVVEKTDITFLEKTIIPNAANYITPRNAVETIRKIFSLYFKQDIGIDTLKLLTPLKLLSTTGTLVTAAKCYFSAEYRPRLDLQPVLNEDIYLSNQYISEGNTHSQWKAFFLLLGVNEGIDTICYDKRLPNNTLLTYGIKQEYLSRQEHKFTFINPYWVEEMKGLITLTLLHYTEISHSFAQIFWNDVIANIVPSELKKQATAYYGRPGKRSRVDGDEVENYLKWYATHVYSLPNSTNTPLNSASIFLNTPENIKVSGKYLPVFEGPDLNADWRTFFNFKVRLDLQDYLKMLTKLSEDPAGDNKIRTQSIYENLLEDYTTWDSARQELVEEWAVTGRLSDVSGSYKPTGELHYYADGDNSIFGNSYSFIQLGVNAKRHPDILNLLALLKVKVLKQDQFGMKASEDLTKSSLKPQLQTILPYWAKWMEKERQSGYEEMLYDLQYKLDSIEILEASELNITYGEDWSKKVVLHYHDNKLYVTTPWISNKVMYALPDKLCDIFPVKKYNNEVAFLLKSSISEIKEHFEEQGIEMPPVSEETTDGHDSGQHGVPLPTPDNDVPQKQNIDYQYYWNLSLERNKTLVQSCNNDPSYLLKQGLKAKNTGSPVNIYHFSHIENAVSIIREGAIKSRQDAVFKDSAGSGIIAQTDAARKVFARFYFRPKTPTQHYVENLGRGKESLSRIGSDPLCPIPVFFVIPIEKAIEQNEWSVSIGSLASPQVEFGNSIETISKFDFDGVYKTVAELGPERFRIAAHQEFLVKDKLELSTLDYQLVVQDENVKKSLLVMLGDLAMEWENKIIINDDFYNQENPKVVISSTDTSIEASLSKEHPGYFILQHSTGSQWEEVAANINRQYNSGNWITTLAGNAITLKGELGNIEHKLFYIYKGRVWLIHTNTSDYHFDYTLVRASLQEWFESAESDIDGLLNILKIHPELNYYYDRPIGGPDSLSLEEHTIAVMNNYLEYFAGTQKIFATEKEYIFCLSLHDIGKPAAMADGNRHMQHIKTLEILERLRGVFPITDDAMHKMRVLINADPIGKYLNSATDYTCEEASMAIGEMSDKLTISKSDFLQNLICYYQCDASGYDSLSKRLFIQVEGRLKMLADKTRLLFNEDYETKFKALIEVVKLLK